MKLLFVTLMALLVGHMTHPSLSHADAPGPFSRWIPASIVWQQRRFVLWWDEQAEDGTHKGGNPTVTGLQRLEDLGVDRSTVYRWRKKLKDEKRFMSYLR